MNEHIDCTHRSTIGRKVQSALFGDSRFPPPSTGAFILARLRRAAARSASDARVAFRVQRMARNVVLPSVRFHVFPAPTRKRANLQPPIFGGKGSQ